MKTIEINALPRIITGKKATKKLRKDGMVPCNLYGGEKNVNFYVSEKELKKIVYTPDVYLISINLENKKHSAILQELQFHVVSDALTHLDFIEVNDNKIVKTEIPVNLVGTSQGVLDGGRMDLVVRRLKVKGLVKDMPETLDINIENLTIGKGIKAGELNFEGLKILNPASTIICSVKVTRVSKSAATAEAATTTKSKK
jgi:large subunit ribosomal protein L25